VFLIATHFASKNAVKLYHDIADFTKGDGQTILLYHQKHESVSEKIAGLNTYVFTDKILQKLGYVPLYDALIPGSNHFSLLGFFMEHPQFNSYWYMEGDIAFNGNWEYFFKAFNKFEYDFISSSLKFFKDHKTWPWWRTLNHPYKCIPLKHRLKSFNPIYRISNSALTFVHKQLLDQWSGHHEVLLPTLLYHHNFRILDFGGKGEFVKPGFKNKFYTSDTLRWRPVFTEIGPLKNKIYHPLKS
ncbi:MAG TPA: DUF707 domain-containing protein, partial [Bacteroidales bacterium]|nr:DUF707 domain-containing protein [Bacteroidales bacterium]